MPGPSFRPRPLTAGLYDPLTIDVVTVDDASQEYVLKAFISVRWTGSPEQQSAFEKKLDAYLAFAFDGTMSALYPDSLERHLRIHLKCHGGIEPGSERYFESVRRALAAEGIRFVVEDTSSTVH